MNKKIISLIIVFFILFQQSASLVYAHYADSKISEWKNKGYLQGINVKNPDRQVSQKEFYSILNALLGGGVTQSSSTKTISREDALMKLMDNFSIGHAGAVNASTKYADFDSITPNNRLYIEQAIVENIIAAPDGKIKFSPKSPLKIGDYIILLDRITGKRIDKSGKYSYYYTDAKTDVINTTITHDFVTLENSKIQGNLYITAGVGNGEITLRDVTVARKLIVMGGGNSIKLENCNIGELYIDRTDGEVIVSIDGVTEIKNTTVKSDAKLIEKYHTEKGFQDIAIGNPDAMVKIDLDGEFNGANITNEAFIRIFNESKIAQLIVEEEAKDSSLDIEPEVTIAKMVLNDFAAPLYSGKIDEINITQDRKRISLQGDIKKVNINASANVDVKRDANIDEINIGTRALDTKLYLDYGSNIKTLSVNAKAEILGEGKVELAKVYAKGVSFAKEVGSLELLSDIGGVQIAGKTVNKGTLISKPKAPWGDYMIRTITNTISVPTKESVRMYIRKDRTVDYLKENNVVWSVENGKGVNYSYINPYTGVLEAQGDGVVYVTAKEEGNADKQITQKIYIGSRLKWLEYPYRDYNIYTGLDITAGPVYITSNKIKDSVYQYTATASPSSNKNSKIIWSVENLSGEVHSLIDGNGKLTVYKDSGKGNIRITAWLEDQPKIVSQKIIKVDGGVPISYVTTTAIELNIGENIGTVGNITLSAILIPQNKETKDKYTLEVDILDGRFTEHPYIDKDKLYAYGKGRMLVTMKTTDGSDMITQKVVSVDNVTFTDIAIPEPEPQPEHTNDYYEMEDGLKITSDTGSFTVQSLAGYLRLRGSSTTATPATEVVWDVEQIDGDLYYFTIDETTGILTASGKGRLLVTATGRVGALGVTAKKVIEVGKTEVADEKPTIYVTLRNAAKDHPSTLESGKTYQIEAIDSNDKKINDLTWNILEKDTTVTTAAITNGGSFTAMGDGTVTIQAYGESTDGASWYMGYQIFNIQKK